MFTDESKLFKNFLFPDINLPKGKEIKQLYEFLRNVKLLPVQTLTHSSSSHGSIHLESSYATDIIIKASQKLKKKEQLQLLIGQNKISVNICSNEDNKKLIVSVISLLQLLCSIYPNQKEIVLNYFLVDEKKILESTDFPCSIGKSEVNSGSCQRTIDKSIVNIWRKEELIKVSFHELFHALCFDNISDTNEIIELYKSRYNIVSNIININEAYTELWANILNCFWISQKVERKQYQCFQTLLAIEKEFALFQCEKIFYITGLTELEIDINKYTNILSYYVIRCEIYNDLKEFLRLCRIHNKNYIHITNDELFLSFITKTKAIKKNNKRISKLKEESYLFKTTRMTSIEYKIS